MRIVIPHTVLHEQTKHLADRHLPGWVGVQIRPGDDTAYCRLLTDLWATSTDDLLIVEHDMGVHEQVLPQFGTCPNPWCGFEYLVDTWPVVALGCVRFRAQLLAAEPDLMNIVAAIGPEDGGPAAGDWRRLDCRISTILHRRGYTPCRHLPRVQHFHTY